MNNKVSSTNSLTDQISQMLARKQIVRNAEIKPCQDTYNINSTSRKVI